MNVIKLQIIEPILIGLTTILYFFLIQNEFSLLIYLGIICILSLYFFPIKLLNIKNELKFQIILSCFAICASLILSYISIIIIKNESLKIILFVFFILSMYLMFYFRDKNKIYFFNHFFLNSLITMSYYFDILKN
jgi:hypothetical protein